MSAAALDSLRILCKKGCLNYALHSLQLMEERRSWDFVEACACLLHHCTTTKLLAQGKQGHSLLILSPLEPNIYIWNTLINMYIKCGSMDDAYYVFDRLSFRNVATWTSMIGGTARGNNGKEALNLFTQMQLQHVMPDKVTFLPILNACAIIPTLAQGRRVHAFILKFECQSDPFVGSTLVDMYAKCGSIRDSRRVFDSMSDRAAVTWNVMIAAYALYGYGRDSFKLFEQMSFQGIEPDEGTFVSILTAFTDMSLSQCKRIHSYTLKFTSKVGTSIDNMLVDVYFKCGGIESACMVFDRLIVQDTVSWNSMVAGCAHYLSYKASLKLFAQMQQADAKPSQVTFVSFLSSCATIPSLEQGKLIHAFGLNTGYELNIFVGNSLTDMYAKCGSIDQSFQVFEHILVPDVVSWNVTIAGYIQHGFYRRALGLFWQLHQEALETDNVTFLNVIDACACSLAVDHGKLIHAIVLGARYPSDDALYGSLVDMYVKCDRLEDACEVFHRIPMPVIIPWSAIIAGYAECGSPSLALALFSQIELEGLKPNEVTLISILGGRVTINQGKWVHAKALHAGLESNAFVGSSLIDMYAKCGHLEYAYAVFERIPEHDTVSWSALIGGYVQCEHFNGALMLFEQMQCEGTRPNQVTLYCALTACAAIASLNQGRRIHTNIVTFGCNLDIYIGNALIDMYSKSGCVEDALYVFHNMDSRDVLSWNGMIAGLSHHGNGVQALNLFGRMQEGGIPPNESTFTAALSACSHAYMLDEGFQLFNSISNHGITLIMHHFACVVSLLGRGGLLYEAEEFISMMPFQPGIDLWMSLLGACTIHGNLVLGEWTTGRILAKLQNHR